MTRRRLSQGYRRFCRVRLAIEGKETRPVQPGDIAVLVNSNNQAQDVKDALDQRGVPSVIGKAGHIFAADEALYLIQWLRAIQAPQSVERVRTFAVSPLLGSTPDALLDPENHANDQLISLLATWRDLFFRGGLQHFELIPVIGMPSPTQKRRWTTARSWLH